MLKARIITFDPTSKRIGLSLKALDPSYIIPAGESGEESETTEIENTEEEPKEEKKTRAPRKKKEEETPAE